MQSRLSKRILRRLFGLLPKALLDVTSNWRWLAPYPPVAIPEKLLKKWNSSLWEEYQHWLELHSLQTLDAWEALCQQSKRWINPPRLSIVTPVFNTDPEVLYETILSVRAQTYPYWQYILVDDGSSRPETIEVLRSWVCRDVRIRVLTNPKSLGISGATNVGVNRSSGDYVIFLDHDDRLSLEALALVATEISQEPALDIVYSDRDMISKDLLPEKGKRYLHVFKPDWSPECLFSGNYLFHLMCYRRSLLIRLGGLRSEFDGSQDYDLILRAAELHPNVRHIPKVLYHWRQHDASVALNIGAKDYAFQAGINALNDALKRRGINAVAREIPEFWRGTYQIDGLAVNAEDLQVICVEIASEGYSSTISAAINASTSPYIALVGSDIQPETGATLTGLAGWLTLDGVGLATGKLLTQEGKIDYIGMAYKKDASLIYPYRNFPQAEPGYMGVTQLVRNISAPHPFCVVFRRSVWDALSGLNPSLYGPLALLDLALRASQRDWRTVMVPQCRFINSGDRFYAETNEFELIQFQAIWQDWAKSGDPYYNPNLAENSKDMGLDI